MTLPFSLIPYLIEHYHLGGTWASSALFVLGSLLCIVVPYLLGSLNFGIILSSKFYGGDIRKFGSGNAGFTNMLRVYGLKAGILTILGDMAKSAVSVIFGMLMLTVATPIGGYIAAFFVVFGHMYPIYYGFRGGKGVASAAIAIAILSPWAFLVIFGVFLVIVIGTKFVSLGSIMAALVYPFVLQRLYGSGTHILFAMLIMLFVIFQHRTNIKRLMAGKESKISIGKKKKDGENQDGKS